MCCDILGLVRIFQWGVAGGGGGRGGGRAMPAVVSREKYLGAINSQPSVLKLVFSLFCRSFCKNMFSIETVNDYFI